MALLFWIGITANGNVNIPQNWSYAGPGSYNAGSTALFPASNIPKYNDIITFDKFTIGGTVYPLYAPVGDMNGICGPAGATAAQYFQEVRVNPRFPLTIGGSTAFAFRTSSLVVKRGITGSLANDYSNTHYFYLRDCSGVTKPNAYIIIDSQIKENYSISGVAAQLSVGSQYAPEMDRVPYGQIFLPNMELQGRTFPENFNQNGRLNSALHGRETKVTPVNSANQTAQVMIYVYPTTTVTNHIFLEGREKLVVYRGFSLQSHGLFLTSAVPGISTNTPAYSQVEFREDPASFTSTGLEYSTRSYIYQLFMEGKSIVTDNDGHFATLPKVILNHGVDINELQFKYAGQITTSNPQLGDGARILRGRFVAGKAVFVTPGVPQYDAPTLHTQMGFFSDVDNMSFGPAGTFIWENLPGIYPNNPGSCLRSNLRGNWAYKITPVVE